MDLLFDDDHYCVCEVNSAAGFAGFVASTGVNVARAILQHCLERPPPRGGFVFCDKGDLGHFELSLKRFDRSAVLTPQQRPAIQATNGHHTRPRREGEIVVVESAAPTAHRISPLHQYLTAVALRRCV